MTVFQRKRSRRRSKKQTDDNRKPFHVSTRMCGVLHIHFDILALPGMPEGKPAGVRCANLTKKTGAGFTDSRTIRKYARI